MAVERGRPMSSGGGGVGGVVGVGGCCDETLAACKRARLPIPGCRVANGGPAGDGRVSSRGTPLCRETELSCVRGDYLPRE